MKTKPNILDFNGIFFKPPNFHGLEALVRFPDSEFKQRPKNDIPNSTVWVFNRDNHSYIPEILYNDVGCGIAAFIIDEVDPKEASDKFYSFLRGKNILGRGNHFVDIGSAIMSPYFSHSPYSLLLIHSDGKSFDKSVPKSIPEAINKEANASKFRENLGYELSNLLKSSCERLGNWPHNFIEENEKIIYRKGVIKIVPEKVYILTAHLGSMILVYTVGELNFPPYSSMPHGTGRSGPRGETKVSLEEVKSLRKMVYVPSGIQDSSLRTEHPSCYNDFGKIIKSLGKYIIPMGDIEILSYVGKI